MLAKYDDKIEERLFSELDVKYINRFNLEMEKTAVVETPVNTTSKH